MERSKNREREHQNWKRNLRDKNTYISIELPNKTREIIVLEISREKISGERVRIPYNKAAASSAPTNYIISIRIIHHVKGFSKEWRWPWIVETLHRLRRQHHWRVIFGLWITWTRVLFLYRKIWIHGSKTLQDFFFQDTDTIWFDSL